MVVLEDGLVGKGERIWKRQEGERQRRRREEVWSGVCVWVWSGPREES